MTVTVGTFNLNNLFSRFNFKANIESAPNAEDGGITLTFAQEAIKVRTFVGRLVKEKNPVDTDTVARRIREVVNADVLAVQEVEHVELLKEFNRQELGGLYSHVALIEGNDTRLIDVGVLSKYPIGTTTSHQTAVHPEQPDQRVFSRDLLQVEILDHNRNKLFTLYNTHLKSHFVPFNEDPIEGARAANERRRRQAATVSRIIASQERPDSRFVLAGDMNDAPTSEFLQPMLEVEGRPLLNALANASETRPGKAETPGQGPGPATPVWTHRFNPRGPEPPRYELLDQIWVSDALAPRVGGAQIDRRTKHGGDGSDHDPAWIEIDI